MFQKRLTEFKKAKTKNEN